MKKIMIAAVIVCAAVYANAAAITWKSGTNVMPDGSTVAETGTLNTYVFILASEQAYNDLSLDSIWGTYGNSKLSEIDATYSKLGGNGSTGANAKWTYNTETDKGKTYYAAIIITYDKGKDGTADLYAVNKTATEINASGSVVKAPEDLALKIYGTTTDVKWSSAVPEPTSGLLLLLGVAGLALKRKRA